MVKESQKRNSSRNLKNSKNSKAGSKAGSKTDFRVPKSDSKSAPKSHLKFGMKDQKKRDFSRPRENAFDTENSNIDGIPDLSLGSKDPVKTGVRYVEVTAGYEDQRIDNFLIRELKGVPLSHIYRVIRKGEVRVNKKRIEQTYKLQVGDLVRIPPMSTGPKSIPPDPARFAYLKDRIVYEDDTLLILNKPHGLAVHEGSNIQSGLIEALRVLFPEYRHLELVHRLDKETSGLIIIAKCRSTMKLLHDMLRERKIKKTYQAVVVGRWPKGLNKVDLVLEGDKESVTTFQILENREKTTLIEAHPLTGRTHQIRLHCQAAGHSIVGDPLYGDMNFENFNDSPRMFLHAAQLKFTHPKSGEMIVVKAESGF